MNAEDARILREVLTAFEVLDEDDRHYDIRARVAFDFMLSRGRELSEKQRAWVLGVHERLCGTPHYENSWSAGQVPRGREVETPSVLRQLPKRPPGRIT